jgi:hypothetical protein
MALSIAVDTLARIGEVMGDDDAYQFDRVTATGLAGDANGNIYVLDPSGKRVLSYDAAGRHRATWGRPGSGPGELSFPVGLALGDADTVWVLDGINSRMTGYPQDEGEPRMVTLSGLNGFPAGTFTVRENSFLMQAMAPIRFGGGGKGSFQIAAPSARGRAPDSAPRDTSAGDSAHSPRVAARDSSGRGAVRLPNTVASGDDPGTIPVFRADMNGTPGDTLWQSKPPPMNLVQMGGGGRSGGAQRAMLVMAMPPRYQPSLRWAAFSDGGIATVDTDGYRINLVDPDGTVRLVIGRDVPSWQVGDAEKEQARDDVRNARLQMGGANVDMGPIIEQQLASMTFAETVPRIAKIGIDASDRLWVGVSLTRPGKTDRVDLFTKAGLFLGSLSGIDVPDVFTPNGGAASIVKDPDTDVQQVAVMKLVEPARR